MALCLSFCSEDWERMQRALVVYSAQFKFKESEKEQVEGEYAMALFHEIERMLP